MAKPLFSQRHYQVIARELAEYRQTVLDIDFERLVKYLSQRFLADNDKFDESKFKKACYDYYETRAS